MAWACISASGSRDVKVKAGFCLTIIQALCDLDILTANRIKVSRPPKTSVECPSRRTFLKTT